jgi:hypothetical protein
LTPTPDTAPAVFLALLPNPPTDTAEPYLRESLGFHTPSVIKFNDFDTGAAP